MGLLPQQDANGSQRGFAMAMVMFIMLTLLFLGTAYLTWAVHEANLATKEEGNTQAFFLAEAGVQRTLDKLSRTDDWSTISQDLYTNKPLGAGTYTVEWNADSPHSGIINAKGNVKDHERKIDVDVEKRSMSPPP